MVELETLDQWLLGLECFGEGGTMRLFFGIPVSEEVRAFYLETLKPQLEAEFIGKFVETENLHITMLFLGKLKR